MQLGIKKLLMVGIFIQGVLVWSPFGGPWHDSGRVVTNF
jgi:hypothetical protein